ncbi:YkgJ family cysteine cluster protein [Cocleimonas sp. KMM 6892]|uniref:YkgJ family cysteine cluster protein n=1 Tax=unclassified Cocleimonas TaxID=2639732 RepID=UPI002DBDBEF2|nr:MULTISPECIES: YkgJ family cysteine cluster protein [unclassified Cocleimonas]MEB8434493.1 YkgJ family cysteine cluster protein [Cocleimonas sp. KMM 6892]MEC4717386.1 YkgJ family cysteine cluster protein [Cocleimonas sp. KMM 6895]MEC4746820.1 YkgJ family cysteine cluster protein [Cocleimonas sp. KMM 6896]
MKECNSCGKCCIKYSNGQLSASPDEIEYWEVFRPDIAEYVANSKIWTSPETGKLIELCPWLRKAPDSNVYTCDIYFDRPEDCRYYPSTITEMIKDGCEMLDDNDKANPKKAQQDLDRIMVDSRPALE